jgi:hypothetical protein
MPEESPGRSIVGEDDGPHNACRSLGYGTSSFSHVGRRPSGADCVTRIPSERSSPASNRVSALSEALDTL